MFTAPVLWFAAGVLFLGLEMLAPAGVLLFIGLGCLAGWLAALTGAGPVWQTGLATATAVATLILLRSTLRRVFSGCAARDGDTGPASPVTGQQGVITRAAGPDCEGELSVGGSFWRCTCDVPLDRGRKARVTGAVPGDAMLLRVTPVEEPVSHS